jgi:hypothetical protein
VIGNDDGGSAPRGVAEPPAFLMTAAQHRQWAENARRRNRSDLAFHHEQLARIIEKIAREQQAEHADSLLPLIR